MEEFSVIVGYRTELGANSWETMTDTNLGELNISRADIAAVSARFAVPGPLYAEQGIASISHPCGGSACALIRTKDGHNFSIDDVFYYDWNPLGKHGSGLPHWNHERRFIKNGQQVGKLAKKVEDHEIADSPWMIIEMESDGNRISQQVDRDQTVLSYPPTT